MTTQLAWIGRPVVSSYARHITNIRKAKKTLPANMVMEVNVPVDDVEELDTEEYQLTVLVLEEVPKIPINATEFLEIRIAMTMLDQVLVVEEAFNALMDNYRAYELGQMELTLDHALDTYSDNVVQLDSMDDARRRAALDLDNLLSSARAFLDITPGRMKHMGGPKLRNAFSEFTHKEYDTNPSYQFMEDLRNYSQHQGASVSAMNFDISRSDKGIAAFDPDFKLIYSVKSGVHADAILPHFKAQRRAVISQLQDKKGKVTMTPIVRSYIVSLNNIMLATRALLHDLEEAWLGTNDRYRERIKQAGGRKLLNAAVKLVNRRNVDTEYLSPYIRHQLERLRGRNGKLSHLNRVQIAG